MPATIIRSVDDPRLALYRGVSDPELARSHGVFVAEGRFVVRRVLEDSRYRVRSLLLNDAAYRELGPLLAQLDPSIPVFVIDTGDFEAITGINIHRGCLALVERPPLKSVEEVPSGASGGIVVDGRA